MRPASHSRRGDLLAWVWLASLVIDVVGTLTVASLDWHVSPSHFAERFDIKRTQSREFFDELAALCEKELKRTGEFVIPGMVKLVLKKTNARTGRNPATGQPIPIAAKTVVKARIVKQLKDAVLPKKPA